MIKMTLVEDVIFDMKFEMEKGKFSIFKAQISKLRLFKVISKFINSQVLRLLKTPQEPCPSLSKKAVIAPN